VREEGACFRCGLPRSVACWRARAAPHLRAGPQRDGRWTSRQWSRRPVSISRRKTEIWGRGETGLGRSRGGARW